jgi:hypothetical protein
LYNRQIRDQRALKRLPFRQTGSRLNAIPLGANFVKVLHNAVSNCDALLAVIGPNWLTVTDEDGQRKLDNPHDAVRIEIATALKRDISVIPILLDGAKIPRVERLPDELQELALRNGVEVHHASFRGDMDKLIRGLKLAPQKPSFKRKLQQADQWRMLIGSGAVVVVAVAIFWMIHLRPEAVLAARDAVHSVIELIKGKRDALDSVLDIINGNGEKKWPTHP